MKEYLDKYEIDLENEKYKKVNAWKNAIGLQKVDNLTPSNYLYEIAKKNIEDELSFKEANELLHSYYVNKPDSFNREEEADKVSLRIAELFSNNSFSFSILEFINIHKTLFEGIYDHAGKIREYNISKKEWVLDGKSVSYGNSNNLKELLEYDFNNEKNFKYKGLSNGEFVKHISKFISALWQIHPFSEGNTRTTAVFLIKYLNKMGFNIGNDLFSKNSWYFRIALVRANYSNFLLGVEETTIYLEKFIENLLFNKNNKLSNRELHINFANTSNKLSEKEKEILNILKDNPNITLEQCSIEIKKSLRTTKTIVKNLIDNNYVERCGAKKNGYWKVK